MIIGVPKEIKDQEYRVSMVPAGARALVQHGHKVLVEKGAGEASGIADAEYAAAGAEIVPKAQELFHRSDMIVKVKEPLESEYAMLEDEHILFTYLHLAPQRQLTKVLLQKKISAIAYETVTEKGHLLLLTPMSEIAGRMSIQVGAHYLEKRSGGRGVLLGGVPGVFPGRVVVLGGGIVGLNAARMASGLGATVTVLEVSHEQMRYIDDVFGGRIYTLYSNEFNTARAVADADLVIGAVLIPGASAPRLLTRAMMKHMKPGSVFVDVAVDQGGCAETTRVTSHSDPVYTEEGVVHYAVPNMPGAVPRTSTFALTNATIRYITLVADKGVQGAAKTSPALRGGINLFDGKITLRPVADSQGDQYVPLEELMELS
jgi:alanine dehydrogenase